MLYREEKRNSNKLLSWLLDSHTESTDFLKMNFNVILHNMNCLKQAFI
jgi:hypothetical protein